MTDLACAIDFLEDRASLYRLLASLYYQPLSEEQIDALAASDLAKLASDSESPFAPAYRDLHGALRLRHTGTKEELAADFTGAFYGIRTREGRTAQPFESLFRTQRPGQLMGEARSEVYRELRAHQLRVPEGVDLPEDHLSFICAYLAHLCDKTAQALREGDRTGARELLKRQRAFFDAHVASWTSAFLAQAETMVETRFYRGVLKLTGAFLDEEPAAMGETEEAIA
ncbi:molecular chaperone [Adlercreutzia sp. DFI.6.23]|uniref:TorD/DmsD family molecular chaperone n=1 Tax=Adlercreutzia sp. DFI.6.23 TaxID=2963705 RepID=UPI002109D7D0|nr:molecular chaperone TorD family protein [Adlercreutzia sp. DFI.6.23]MCQ5069528.1 molecular chaperone TorD family protein [Adlercreutzia sp. DFI.6.23]